jgi:hypothetical protein
VVHFQVPTDPWYIFKCPRLVNFGCPPRLKEPRWYVAQLLEVFRALVHYRPRGALREAFIAYEVAPEAWIALERDFRM